MVAQDKFCLMFTVTSFPHVLSGNPGRGGFPTEHFGNDSGKGNMDNEIKAFGILFILNNLKI